MLRWIRRGFRRAEIYLSHSSRTFAHNVRRRIKVYKIPTRIRFEIRNCTGDTNRNVSVRIAQRHSPGNGCYTKSRARKRICRWFRVARPPILWHRIRTVRQKLRVLQVTRTLFGFCRSPSITLFSFSSIVRFRNRCTAELVSRIALCARYLASIRRQYVLF